MLRQLVMDAKNKLLKKQYLLERRAKSEQLDFEMELKKQEKRARLKALHAQRIKDDKMRPVRNGLHSGAALTATGGVLLDLALCNKYM